MNRLAAALLVLPPFLAASDASAQVYNPNAQIRVRLPVGTTNFFADASATGCGGSGCSDLNNGLTRLTATKTVLGALYAILNGYDFTSSIASEAVAQINMMADEINTGPSVHFGAHGYLGASAGSSVIIDGGGHTLEHDSSAGAGPISAFIGPVFQLQNITLANKVGVCVTEYEHAGIRFGPGVVVGDCSIFLQTSSGSVADFLNNFTIATDGPEYGLVHADENSLVTFAGGINATVLHRVAYTWMFLAQKNSAINLNGLSWTGASNVTGGKYLATDGATIVNGAAQIPGTLGGATAAGGTADGAPLAVSAGGTGASSASAAALDAISGFAGTGQIYRQGGDGYAFFLPSSYAVVINGVDFHTADADTAIPIPLPAGVSTYAVAGVRIFNPSASLTNATFGLFGAPGGAGAPLIPAGTAIVITATAANADNNMQTIAAPGANTAAYNFRKLYFRVGAAEASPAKADVMLTLVPAF